MNRVVTHLLKNATAQYIDSAGKMRAIQTRGLIVIVSPLAPASSLPQLTEDEIRQKFSLAAAKKILTEHKLHIARYTPSLTDRTKIIGAWVDFDNGGFLYIRLQEVDAPDDATFETNVTDPLVVDSKTSALAEYQKTRRAAHVLKQYALYEYALNPSEFGHDTFVVANPKFLEDIPKLRGRLFKYSKDKLNGVMYNSDGKLKVPSEKTIEALVSYVRATVLNNPKKVLGMAVDTSISGYYQTLQDFREVENQIVFMSKTGVQQWKDKEIRRGRREGIKARDISDYEDYADSFSAARVPDATPDKCYYLWANDRLSLVQNTSSVKSAQSIIHKWLAEGTNYGPGYTIDRIPSEKSISFYDIHMETDRENGVYHIIRYGDEIYGALLRLV